MHNAFFKLPRGLFTQSEFFDQLPVPGKVGLAQVGEQALSFAYQLHQATVSGEIFFIGLQVQRNAVDPLRQQSNLALDRAGVGGFATEV